MKKIYIVKGTTGEWEDIITWTVAVYPTKLEAMKHLKATKREYKKLYDNYGDRLRHMIMFENLKNKYDPKMDVDYNGTRYYVYSLDITETFADFKEKNHD